MATGRKTVVVGQVLDPDVWGNPLWDQSVQTFATAADRLAQFPAPKAGAVTWLDDVKRHEYWTGTSWQAVAAPVDGRLVAGVTDGAGVFTFNHFLPLTPTWCVVSPAQQSTDALSLIMTPVVWALSATQIKIAIRREDTHVWFPGQPVSLHVSYGVTLRNAVALRPAGVDE